MSVGKKLNKKDLLSTNLATKHGYCTQRTRLCTRNFNDLKTKKWILENTFKKSKKDFTK